MPKLSPLEMIAAESGEQLAGKRRAMLKAEPREGAGVLETRRVTASKRPLEMAGNIRARPVELVPNVARETQRGEALDLSALGAWDAAHFQPLERKAPTKVSERAKRAFTEENTRAFENYVRRGIREGGLNWYDLSPLSRPALQEMTPEDFSTLVAMNAAASARSSVSDQIKRASLAWYLKHQGLEWPMSNWELLRNHEGYGHLAHDIHSKHLGPLVSGEHQGFSPTSQPKYASYYGNFLGNVAPLTADTHYQTLHGFPMKQTWNKRLGEYIEGPDFSKDVDYPFAEAFSGERARRMGIPLSAYQSSGWVGGRDVTGVRDARPFAAVYDELIANTARQLDITPQQALRKHLRGEIPLLPIERADGGLVIPKVLFHGATRAVKNLRPGKGRWVGSEDLGVHVGSSESANRRLEDARKEGRRGAPNIMPLYHQIQNPLRMDDIGNWKSPSRVENELARLFPDRAPIVRSMMKRYDSTDSEDGAMEILRRELLGLGHDSVVYKNAYEGGGDSYIVLDPATLKSKFGLAGGGAPKLNVLRDYIRKRLPKRYESEELRHIQDLDRPGWGGDEPPPVDPSDPSFGGSGRDIFGLGPDKIVKIAKRPRGLYEQSLEGNESVRAFLPKLHWRSPDNELTVVERMQLTPTPSKEFFEPLRERVLETRGRSPIPAYRRHRDDPQLAAMMEERGLEPFQNFNIHAGDFFLAPDRHWAIRNPRMTMNSPFWRGRPTLLDPGALDYRITDPEFEKKYAGPFRDVLDERIKSIVPQRFYARPEELIENALARGRGFEDLNILGIGRGTEDFIGPRAQRNLRPVPAIAQREPGIQPPRLTGGMAAGGIAQRLKSLRQHLAGGGVPRNWLRGVKGSKFDEVLKELKRRVGFSEQDAELLQFLRRGNHTPEELGTLELQHQIDDPATAIKNMTRAESLGKWLDTNFANYLTRQFGTPGDPLKDFEFAGRDYRGNRMRGSEIAEEVLKKVPAADVPKHLAGEFFPPHVPREEHRGRRSRRFELTPEQLEANAAARGEYERVLSGADLPPWLKRIYDQDRPRKLLEQRRNAQIKASSAKYVSDVPPLYDLNPTAWRNAMGEDVTSLIDWLRHATTPNEQGVAEILPERLSRVSVPQAFESARQWHEELARKAEEAKNRGLEAGPWMKEHKAYPTGFKWMEYDPTYVRGPGYKGPFGASEYSIDKVKRAQFQHALSAEGESMGHCVGSYCDSVLSGQTRILSLRDPKGRPHVTVEVRPVSAAHSRSQAVWNTLPESIKSGYEEYFRGTGRHSMDFGRDFPEWAKKNHPELFTDPPMNITQIKGKGNAAPVAEYLPYVQDFVRSGKWGDVGDLQNTGLVRAGGHYMTPQEAAPYRRFLWGGDRVPDKWLTESEMVDQVRAAGNSSGMLGASSSIKPEDVPQYLRGLGRSSEGRSWRYEGIPADWQPPPQEFAEGGAVRPADFPVESVGERLMRAKFALSLLLAERANATPAELPSLDREIARVQSIIARLEATGAQTESRVKDGPAATQADAPVAPAVLSGSAAPTGALGEEQDLYDEETLGMLGRFITGDPTKSNFLAQLLGEEIGRHP